MKIHNQTRATTVGISSFRVITRTLARRIETGHGAGIVVGATLVGSRRMASVGRLSLEDEQSPDGDTLFEIGSITKVFTSLLLTELACSAELALDEPVQDLLPVGTHVPSRGGKSITLKDLATHTSGLPYLPGNFSVEDASDPYASYTVVDLYRFLSAYALPRDIGIVFEYSNLGMGLLGHALACRTGVAFDDLLRSRVLLPLQLNDTYMSVPTTENFRLARGYDTGLSPTPGWNFGPAFAAAGGLRSTANDQLRFLEAMLQPQRSSLETAIATMFSTIRPTDEPNIHAALGWIVDRRGDDEIIWHSGSTGGYRSLVGFSRGLQSGVVVLANSANEISDIGLHLLNRKHPLAD